MKFFIAAITLLFLPFASHASQSAATFDCDKEYSKINGVFQKLFDTGKYDDAYNTLVEYVDYCDWIKDKRMYWIWRDLSLAAYKMNDAKKCLDTIQTAEEFLKSNGPDKYYGDKKIISKMTPPPSALKAIAQNKELCQRLKKRLGRIQ